MYLAAIQEVIEFQICNQDLGQNCKAVNLLSIYNSNIKKALEKDTNVLQSCRSKQKRLHPRPLIQKSPHLGSLPYMQWVSRGLFLPLFFPLARHKWIRSTWSIVQNPHAHCAKSTCPLQIMRTILVRNMPATGHCAGFAGCSEILARPTTHKGL